MHSLPSVPRAAASLGLAALATACAIVCTTGCVGVPFALPPTQVTVATGVEASRGRAEVPLQVRAAVHPMQFSPAWTNRDFDLGVGYMLDATRSLTLHGGYAEGARCCGSMETTGGFSGSPRARRCAC